MTTTTQDFNAADADLCRQTFETWFEPSGRGLERDAEGNYKFMTAHSLWGAWKAGWEAKTLSNTAT